MNIEITEKDQKWIGTIEDLPYVKGLEVFGNQLKVEVENLENNKNLLLGHALKHDVDIVKFEVGNDTLEDIFLKLVVEK